MRRFFVHHTGQLREGTPDSAFSSGEERTVPYFSNVWSSPPRSGGVWGRPCSRHGVRDGAGRSLGTVRDARSPHEDSFFSTRSASVRANERRGRNAWAAAGIRPLLTLTKKNKKHNKKNKKTRTMLLEQHSQESGDVCFTSLTHPPPPHPPFPPPAPASLLTFNQTRARDEISVWSSNGLPIQKGLPCPVM